MKLPDYYRQALEGDSFLSSDGKRKLIEILTAVYGVFAHDPVLDDTDGVWF